MYYLDVLHASVCKFNLILYDCIYISNMHIILVRVT